MPRRLMIVRETSDLQLCLTTTWIDERANGGSLWIVAIVIFLDQMKRECVYQCTKVEVAAFDSTSNTLCS